MVVLTARQDERLIAIERRVDRLEQASALRHQEVRVTTKCRFCDSDNRTSRRNNHAAEKSNSPLNFNTFLNGYVASTIVIDTSGEGMETINYVATDNSSMTSTRTRTVILEAAAP